MSTLTNEVIATAKSAAIAQVQPQIDQAKTSFLALFGSFLKPEDLKTVALLFDKAVLAKVGQFSAATNEEATEYSDEYEGYLQTVETIGDRYEIVGKAKAGVWLRNLMHNLISGFFAVAGAVLQVGLGVFVPVAGSFIGAALNQGLQHVVAYYNEGS